MQIALTKNPDRLKAYSLAWKFLDLLYPPRCVYCGKIGYRCCPTCWNERILFNQPVCPVCGRPLEEGLQCIPCTNTPIGINSMRSLGNYEGILRAIVISLKYYRNLGLAEILLPDILQTFENWEIEKDLFLPVPLSKKRKRERGYNQVSLWGKLTARILATPYSSTALIRRHDTASQVSLSADQRWKNVRNAFKADTQQVKEKNIILLDDVTTTGATISECARALMTAGARKVAAFTLTRSSIQNHNEKIGGIHV